MSSVQVLTPNGRRQTVKCTPNTTILEILEFVCNKHEFDVDNHELRHHNKPLDVTVPFRFSGLPNNAQIEMAESKTKRQETEVIICLQQENGERITGTFAPHQTLQEIIETLVKDDQDHPVIIYMRKEVFGEDLKSATLKSLGITSGRAMLRLINKRPEELKQQANVSTTILPKPPKEEPERPRKQQEKNDILQMAKEERIVSTSSAGTEKTETEEIAAESEQHSPTQPSTSKKSKLDVVQVSEPSVDLVEHQIITLGERNAVLFSLETVQQTNFDDIPDSFFELTVNDVKKLYQEMKLDVESMQNRPLLTSELRAAEEQQKRSAFTTHYKQAILRIQLPERFVLQGTFLPEETIEDVKQFVASHLKDPSLDFHLFATPPKRILEGTLGLIDAKCVPSAIIHFGTDEPKLQNRYLKDELYEKVSTAAAAASSVTKLRNEAVEKMVTDEPTAGTSNSSTSGGQQQPRVPTNFMKSKVTGTDADAKVPKWFKPNK